MKRLFPVSAALGLCLFVPLASAEAAPAGRGSPSVYYELAEADNVLQAGTVIPATLLTPIISDNSSTLIIAVVRQDVYDSVTGTQLLIPAGSRLIGDPMGMTGRRIDISFNRVIFPNGHSIDLPDYRAIDGIGYSGVKDQYTRHTWLKTRSILTGAILGGIVAGATDDDDRDSRWSDNKSAGEEARDAAIGQMLTGIEDMVREENADLRPTGTIREGYQFNVILNTDIRIRPYAR